MRPSAMGRGTLRTNQTLGSVADQILPMELDERLSDQGRVLGSVVLKQRPLQLLFVIVGGNVDPLHIEGVDPRVEHNGGGSTGGGIIILNLLGGVVVPLQTESKLSVISSLLF